MRQTHLRRALPGLLPGRILEMQMLWSRMGAGSLVQRYTYRYGDIPAYSVAVHIRMLYVYCIHYYG